MAYDPFADGTLVAEQAPASPDPFQTGDLQDVGQDYREPGPGPATPAESNAARDAQLAAGWMAAERKRQEALTAPPDTRLTTGQKWHGIPMPNLDFEAPWMDPVSRYAYRFGKQFLGQSVGALGSLAEAGLAAALPERYGGFERNIKDLMARDVSGAAREAGVDVTPPMEAEANRMIKTGSPWEGYAVKFGKGMAGFLPKMAMLELINPVVGTSTLASMALTGGLFGLQADGTIEPKQAAIGAFLPLLGKTVASGMTKLAAGGVTALEKPIVAKIVADVADQTALNVAQLVADSPELAELYRKDPEAFKGQLFEMIGQNAAFSLFGLRKYRPGELSPVERVIFSDVKRSTDMADRMLDRRLNKGEAMYDIVRREAPGLTPKEASTEARTRKLAATDEFYTQAQSVAGMQQAVDFLSSEAQGAKTEPERSAYLNVADQLTQQMAAGMARLKETPTPRPIVPETGEPATMAAPSGAEYSVRGPQWTPAPADWSRPPVISGGPPAAAPSPEPTTTQEQPAGFQFPVTAAPPQDVPVAAPPSPAEKVPINETQIVAPQKVPETGTLPVVERQPVVPGAEGEAQGRVALRQSEDQKRVAAREAEAARLKAEGQSMLDEAFGGTTFTTGVDPAQLFKIAGGLYRLGKAEAMLKIGSLADALRRKWPKYWNMLRGRDFILAYRQMMKDMPGEDYSTPEEIAAYERSQELSVADQMAVRKGRKADEQAAGVAPEAKARRVPMTDAEKSAIVAQYQAPDASQLRPDGDMTIEQAMRRIWDQYASGQKAGQGRKVEGSKETPTLWIAFMKAVRELSPDVLGMSVREIATNEATRQAAAERFQVGFQKLLDDGLTNSAGDYIMRVKQIFTLAKNLAWIDDPTTTLVKKAFDVMMPEPDTGPSVPKATIGFDQLQQLLFAIEDLGTVRGRSGKELALLASLPYLLAARKGDVEDLKWSDVQPEVAYQAQEGGRNKRVFTGQNTVYVKNSKTGADYWIPEHSALRQVLDSIREFQGNPGPDDYVFRTSDGRRVKGTLIDEVYRSGAKLANSRMPPGMEPIPSNISAHGGRAFMLSMGHIGGLPKEVSEALIGHATKAELARAYSAVSLQSYMGAPEQRRATVLGQSLPALEKAFSQLFGSKPGEVGFFGRIAPKEVRPAEAATKPVEGAKPAGGEDVAALGRIKATDVDPRKLKLSRDVENFKTGASETGETEPIQATEYKRLPENPIVVWRRLNGDLEVITGRHRWQLALRLGEKSISAQIVEEAKGFTREMAMILDAESNIRDGPGTAYDYAQYFTRVRYSESDAKARGLLRSSAGNIGFRLSQIAEGPLRAWYSKQRLREGRESVTTTDRQAIAIAEGAKGNAALEEVGISYADKGTAPAAIKNQLDLTRADLEKMAREGRSVKMDQMDFLQSPEVQQAMARNQAINDFALEAQRTAKRRTNNLLDLQRGLKVPAEELKALFGDAEIKTAALPDMIKAAREEEAKWENWTTNSELVNRIRQQLGFEKGGESNGLQGQKEGQAVSPPPTGNDVQLAPRKHVAEPVGDLFTMAPGEGVAGRVRQMRENADILEEQAKKRYALSLFENMERGRAMHDEGDKLYRQSVETRRQADDLAAKFGLQEQKPATPANEPAVSKVVPGQMDLLGPPPPERTRPLPPGVREHISTMEMGPMSSEQFREVINMPGLGLDPFVVRVMNGVLDSGAGQKLKLNWLLRDALLREGVEGGYDPVTEIARLFMWTKDPRVGPHEFFHGVFPYLEAADQRLINEWRYRTLLNLQATTTDVGLARTIAWIIQRGNEGKPVSSVEAQAEDPNAPGQGTVPDEYYHLINDGEYFAWMMGERAAKEFRGDASAGSFISRMREVFRSLWESFKSILGLTPAEDKLWRKVIEGGFQYSPEVAKEYGPKADLQLSRKPTAATLDNFPENSAIAQDRYGKEGVVWRAASKEIADIERNATKADTRRYAEYSLTTAKSNLRQIEAVANNIATNSSKEVRDRIDWKVQDGPETVDLKFKVPPWNSQYFTRFIANNWEVLGLTKWDLPMGSPDATPEAVLANRERRIADLNRTIEQMKVDLTARAIVRREDVLRRKMAQLRMIEMTAGEKLWAQRESEIRARLTQLQNEIQPDAALPESQRAADVQRRLNERTREEMLRFAESSPMEKMAPDVQATYSRLLSEARKLEPAIAKKRRSNENAANRADELRKMDLESVDADGALLAKNLPVVKEYFFESMGRAAALQREFWGKLRTLSEVLGKDESGGNEKNRAAVEFLKYLNDYREASREFGRIYDRRMGEVKSDIESLANRIALGVNETFDEEFLLDASVRALKGDQVRSKDMPAADVEMIIESREALRQFAKSLVRDYPEWGAQSVRMDLLLGPGARAAGDLLKPPGFLVSDEFYAAAMRAMERSPEFANSVTELMDYYWAKEAKIFDRGGGFDPANAQRELNAIAQLVTSSDEKAQKEGRDRASSLMSAARELIGKRSKIIEGQLRDLRDALVNESSLRQAKTLFDAVDGAPAVDELRLRAQDLAGEKYRMVEANGEATIFRAFGQRPEDLVFKSDTTPIFLPENFAKVTQYFRDAERYLIDYETMDSEGLNPEKFGTDKATTDAGIQLGVDPNARFDLRHYRGLRDAMERNYPSWSDPTAIFFDSKLMNSKLQQFMLGWGFFRQHLQSVHHVQGPVGRELQSYAVWYGNNLRSVERVMNQHLLTIAKLRSAALRSHPNLRNVVGDYRDVVFAELGAEGRKFGSRLRAGYVLPLSGEKVTAEDLAFMDRMISMHGDFRRLLSQRFFRGIRLTSENKPTLIRSAQEVGDRGLNMRLGMRAENFASRLLEAVTRSNRRSTIAADDLSWTDSHPVIQFWNDNIDMAVNHIMDSGRAYRDVVQDPRMRRAEQSLAAKIRANGKWTNTIKPRTGAPKATLEDLVIELSSGSFGEARHLTLEEGDYTIPDSYGFVKDQLLRELQQYEHHAGTIGREGQKSASESANFNMGIRIGNEYTAPAAHFRLPSSLYDFGEVTDYDYRMLPNRVMHEPIIEYTRALERALSSLNLDNVFPKDSSIPYTDMREVDRIKGIVRALISDLKKDWEYKDVSQLGIGEFPGDTIKAGLLAGAPVNIRNVTLGQTEVSMMMMRLHRASNAFGMLHALSNLPRIAKGFLVDILFASPSGETRFLKKILDSDIIPFSRFIANRIVDSHLDRVGTVQDIGFSLRTPLIEKLKQNWRASREFASEKEYDLRNGTFSQSVAKARAMKRSLVDAMRWIGTEYFDKLINSAASTFEYYIEDALAEASLAYAPKRAAIVLQRKRADWNRQREEALKTGATFDRPAPTESSLSMMDFDASDPMWAVTPDEFSKRKTSAMRQKNLGEWTKFAASADLSLPMMMWRYYLSPDSKLKGTRILSADERDRIRAALIRESNAGDALSRASEARNNKYFRFLATFQGYAGDFLLKTSAVPVGTRGMTFTDQFVTHIATITGLAAAAAVFGLFSQEFVEDYRRKFQKKSVASTTMLSKEFWTKWQNAKDGIVNGAFSSIPLLGDLALFVRGALINNRGYEPTGRILSFGVMNSMFNTAKGIWALKGDPKSMPLPLRNFLLQYTPYGKEVSSRVMPGYASKSDYSGVTGLIMTKADALNLMPDRPAMVKSGINYTPTYGIKEELISAMMQNDPTGVQAAYDKLLRFYAKRGDEQPEKAANRDVQNLNPTLRGFGGKKPTDEEFERVMAALNDAQRAKVNSTMDSWRQAADQLGVNVSEFKSPGGSAAPAGTSSQFGGISPAAGVAATGVPGGATYTRHSGPVGTGLGGTGASSGISAGGGGTISRGRTRRIFSGTRSTRRRVSARGTYRRSGIRRVSRPRVSSLRRSIRGIRRVTRGRKSVLA
jgi:integrase